MGAAAETCFDVNIIQSSRKRKAYERKNGILLLTFTFFCVRRQSAPPISKSFMKFAFFACFFRFFSYSNRRSGFRLLCGPGIGLSLILTAKLFAYLALHPEKKICCWAVLCSAAWHWITKARARRNIDMPPGSLYRKCVILSCLPSLAETERILRKPEQLFLFSLKFLFRQNPHIQQFLEFFDLFVGIHVNMLVPVGLGLSRVCRGYFPFRNIL